MSATGEAFLQPFDAAARNDLHRPPRSCTSRLSRGEKHHAFLRSRKCFPPLAEGQAYQRLGRRLYSRLTRLRETTCIGLSARVPRDSPEERNIYHWIRYSIGIATGSAFPKRSKSRKLQTTFLSGLTSKI